nr:hypothetical protein ACMD2_04623 [Ipomoea batatas]
MALKKALSFGFLIVGSCSFMMQKKQPPGVFSIFLGEFIDMMMIRDSVASVCLDSGELGVFQVHEKSRFLAEIAKDNVPYYLCWPLAPGLQCVWISSEFEDETILAIDLLFARAFCIGKHVDSSSRVHVCAKPRRMPPNEATVRASVNFIATKRKLNVPHVGIHLPEHKTTRIRRFRRVPVLYNLGGCLEIRGQHLQLAHRVCIGDT